MITIFKRPAIVALALLAMSVGVEATAACCGRGTTAHYPSAYTANYAGANTAYYGGSYNAYYPSTYQTYSSGWYPGYYWNQVRARMWGSPSTYVAAYPTSAYYSAGYAPSYSAGYAPSYSAGYAPAYAYSAPSYAAPAAPACQSCTAGYAPSGCSTCGVQQVTMRPVCTTACSSPCSSGCSTCSSQVVTQTSYEQPACSNCAAHAGTVQVQQNATPAAQTPDPAELRTFDPSTSTSGTSTGPTIDPGANVPEQRIEQKPPVNGATQDVDPAAGDDTDDTGNETGVEDPYKVNGSDSSTYFEAPKLHDPNDRTAQRGIAPVKTALYKQPVSHRSVSTQRVTADQARQDAIGWTSASK